MVRRGVCIQSCEREYAQPWRRSWLASHIHLLWKGRFHMLLADGSGRRNIDYAAETGNVQVDTLVPTESLDPFLHLL